MSWEHVVGNIGKVVCRGQHGYKVRVSWKTYVVGACRGSMSWEYVVDNRVQVRVSWATNNVMKNIPKRCVH